MLSWWILDVESTGLDAKRQEITEVSIIRASDKTQITRMVKCDRPQNASVDALRITNKTLADLSKGDSKKDVVGICNKFFASDGLNSSAARCIIGHNVSFDRKFLHAMWEEVGEKFPADLYLDTLVLVKEFIKNADISKLNITKTATGKISKKLEASCDLVGIKKLPGLHASKADSRNTYLLWQKLIELGIDYLPHIKTFPHAFGNNEEGIDVNEFMGL